MGGALKLAPADGGAVALDISVSAKNVRSSLGAGDAIDPKDAPPTNVEARLLATGASARQMASGANGRVVVTQGPGKLPSGVIGLIGGDLLRELVGKLNPFAAQDPYTQLECTVVRADIVDGQVTVNPVLMQSGEGHDRRGRQDRPRHGGARFDFNTRPRTGVGISAGMFTNPFIEVAGTLVSPRLGVGARDRRRRCDRRTVGARAGAAGPRPAEKPGTVQADAGGGRRQGEMSRCRLKDSKEQEGARHRRGERDRCFDRRKAEARRRGGRRYRHSPGRRRDRRRPHRRGVVERLSGSVPSIDFLVNVAGGPAAPTRNPTTLPPIPGAIALEDLDEKTGTA